MEGSFNSNYIQWPECQILFDTLHRAYKFYEFETYRLEQV